MTETAKDLRNGTNIVIANEDSILMVRHNYGDKLWSLPGGGIKQGEITTDAARRELHEETNITVTNLDPICLFTMTKTRDAQVHLFEGLGWEGFPRPNIRDEISECKFLEVFGFESIQTAEEAIKKGFYPAQVSFVKTYLHWIRNGKQLLYGLPTLPPKLKMSHYK